MATESTAIAIISYVYPSFIACGFMLAGLVIILIIIIIIIIITTTIFMVLSS